MFANSAIVVFGALGVQAPKKCHNYLKSYKYGCHHQELLDPYSWWPVFLSDCME